MTVIAKIVHLRREVISTGLQWVTPFSCSIPREGFLG